MQQPPDQPLVVGEGSVEIEDDGPGRQDEGQDRWSRVGRVVSEAVVEDPEVEATLELVPELAGKDRKVTELEGGLTNRNLKVTTAECAYVVRIWSDDGALLSIDRDNEHQNSVAAAEAGVGAPVIAYLPERNSLVIEFIDGPTLRAADLRDGDWMEPVAAACRRLHGAEAFRDDFDMFEIQAGYLRLVTDRGFRLPDRYREFEPQVEAIREAMSAQPGAARPLQQRPARRELHRLPGRPAAHRLRVLGQQRAELRARQHLERVGALRQSAHRARRGLLRGRLAGPGRPRAALGADVEVRLDALGVDPARGLDDRLRLLVLGDGEVRAGGRRIRRARTSSGCSPTRGGIRERASGRGGRCNVIGGGVGGASVALHLAKLGREVVVVEQHELGEGTTWHSAGFVGQLRSTISQTRMIMYSTDLYRELGTETGLDPGWRGVGGLRVATTPERVEELHRQESSAATYGLELDLLSPAETADRLPLLETSDILASAWLPGDGYVDPELLAAALAEAARSRGAVLHTGTRVTGLSVTDGRVTGIETDRGAIAAETVVIAAGAANPAWSARWVEPQFRSSRYTIKYVVTEPLNPPLSPEATTVRDPDSINYFRPENGGLLVGGWSA